MTLSRSNTLWIRTVHDDEFVRVPVRFEHGFIVYDWSRSKPFTPPALCVPLPPHLPRYHRIESRAAHIQAIARDPRLHSRSQYTRGSLIEDVMAEYVVTRSNARNMICRARKYKRLHEVKA